MVHIGRKKTFQENENCPFSRFEHFEHAKRFLFVLNFEHVNFAINGKYSQFFLVIQTIMFHL